MSSSSTAHQGLNFAKVLSSNNNSSTVGATMGNSTKFLLPIVKNIETKDQCTPLCFLHFRHNLPGIPFPNGKTQSETKYAKHACPCKTHTDRNDDFNAMSFISKELIDTCVKSSGDTRDFISKDLRHTWYGFSEMKDSNYNNSDCDSLSITSYSDMSELEYSVKPNINDETLNADISSINSVQNGFTIPNEHKPTNYGLESHVSDINKDTSEFKSKATIMRHILFPNTPGSPFDLAAKPFSWKRDLGKRGGLLQPIERTIEDRRLLKPIVRSNTYCGQESCKRKKNNTAKTKQRQKVYLCEARRDKSVHKDTKSDKNVVFTSDSLSIGDHIGISSDYKENLPNQINYEYESKTVSLNDNRVFQCHASAVSEVENSLKSDDKILFGTKEIKTLINNINATSNGRGGDCLSNIPLSKTFKVISNEQSKPNPVTAYSVPPSRNYKKSPSKFSCIFDTFLCCKRNI